MAVTVRDMIRGSLRLIGALAEGETPSAAQQSDVLFAFNQMIESFSNDPLLSSYKVREEFTLVPSTQSYTIGTGGTFSTTRPLEVYEAGLEIQGSSPTEIPVDIINDQQWADIRQKSVSSSIPRKIYIEDAFPLSNVHVWPVPEAAHKLVLYSRKPLDTYSSYTTEINLPPGYLRMYRYNLAVEVAPEFGKEPSGLVLQTAMDSKAAIKRTNTKPIYLECDRGVLPWTSGFNIVTGE